MATNRDRMTARAVPLRSDEARDSRVGGTVAERLSLVDRLSEDLWARTHRPLPGYTRATMPIRVFALRELTLRD